MITKLPITYPAPPLARVNSAEVGLAISPSETKPDVERIRQAVRFVVAAAIEAIVILAFVLSSQGIGSEGRAGTGPDQPPQFAAPAPAPDVVPNRP